MGVTVAVRTEMDTTIVLLTIICVILTSLLWKRYRNSQILWEAGHVGPRGSLLTGNYFNIRKNGAFFMFEKWFKEYKRDIVGFYYGSLPCIVCKDLELTKQILIKDFQKFKNRTQMLRLEAAHPVIGTNLLFSLDERWKATRNFMTPNFSTVNMRVMFERLNLCTNEFLCNIEAAEGNFLDVYKLSRRLTLDNISRGAFSVVTNVQKNGLGPRPDFQRAAEDSFDFLGDVWPSPLIQSFKPLGRVVFRILKYLNLVRHPMDSMIEYMDAFINLRAGKKVEKGWVDFMQTMVNAGSGGEMEKRKFHSKLDFELSKEEVAGNCLLFFTAAFETTSAAMSFMYYLLGKNPWVQLKLREQLINDLEDEEVKDLSYDFVMNHKYLDMVVGEALRFYPTANGVLGREAAVDYEFKGVKIPKGTSIIFSAYSIHRDPKNFQDPERFWPERFSVENKSKIPSMAYLPFGEGQRSCVGNRFALMTMKLALARTILKYNIVLDLEKHMGELGVLDKAAIQLQPKGGVHVRFEDVAVAN